MSEELDTIASLLDGDMSSLSSGVTPFSLLDEEDLLPNPSLTSSSAASLLSSDGSSTQLRGGLTSEHLDPIASRQWKTVLSWITFDPDQVATLLDREGQTALHHACLFRAPANVVEAMLYAAPEIASIANDEGELALHWAVRLSLPIEVMKLLLEANPKAGFVRDASGHTPFSLLWDRHDDTLMDVFRIYGRKKTTSFSSWKRMLMLVQRFGGSDTERYPLHSMVHCPCPPSFVRFATKVCRRDVRMLDPCGNLPLHVAASAPATDHKTIDILLREYPKAAHTKDGLGRLPIHLALEAGRTWEEGVNLLLYAAPSALSVQDYHTSLYPFMLAATTTKQEDDGNQLTSVYALLKEDPSLVQCMKNG